MYPPARRSAAEEDVVPKNNRKKILYFIQRQRRRMEVLSKRFMRLKGKPHALNIKQCVLQILQKKFVCLTCY